ncbi:MAG: putative hydrolase or acyltransferase of alpha/beta superfamily [Deltaproteobacteria bacterium]|nr:putative hydrolase or acyltransferase of alpha/beta superfamily [Deltaproteobacteria bacterium]
MPFRKINDFNIYYEVHGEGETIVFLHHGFGCLKIWNKIYPSFVTEGFNVVMYDRRGFGQSKGGYDFFEFYESDRYRPESVEELHLIKESLGIGACHLVGQCEGGVVGIDYAIKYPQEVKTLTVASTQCYSEVPMTELNAIRLVNTFAQLEPELQAKMIGWHGEQAEAKYDQFAKQGGAYGFEYFDLRPILHMVTCPTLVLYPDRSSIFDVEQSIAFYRHLPKGELAVFPRCGHNTYEQRPEEYIHTVLDFFKRIRESGDSRVRPSVSCLA